MADSEVVVRLLTTEKYLAVEHSFKPAGIENGKRHFRALRSSFFTYTLEKFAKMGQEDHSIIYS